MHLSTHLKGRELLRSPLYNKGSSFSKKERDLFFLHGLLPHHISTIHEQVMRRYANFSSKLLNIEKYQFLSTLQDRNEILFYRLVLDHIEEILPFIYTPTVGEATVDYSLHYNESRGLYIPYDQMDNMGALFSNIDGGSVDIIVVTDGGRVLGLGDMGMGGMAICIGKLALYTIFGGISPYRVLPILLDVGTNNELLLQDPLYLGLRHKRIEGEEYGKFIDTFIQEVRSHCPKALLQWEDFPRQHAHTLYTRYKNTLCSFNDDIQGTATVSLAAILAATKTVGRNIEDERFCIVGAGSAGTGIAEMLVAYFQQAGLSKEKALANIFFIDREGLVQKGISQISSVLDPFVKDPEEWQGKGNPPPSLYEVVKQAKITTLIGVSTQRGLFNRKVVKAMLKHTDRPVILPLSNPTDHSEATPADLLKWTSGRAIIATGSPFPPVWYKKKRRTISQCNNLLVFPAIGLAATAVRMQKVPTEAFIIAAQMLSNEAPSIWDPDQPLFPDFTKLRSTTQAIAYAIAKESIAQGIAQYIPEDLERCIEEAMWYPDYPELQPLD